LGKQIHTSLARSRCAAPGSPCKDVSGTLCGTYTCGHQRAQATQGISAAKAHVAEFRTSRANGCCLVCCACHTVWVAADANS
jgi:hypothetical protein